MVSEKGKLTREFAGKHKVIFKFIANHLKTYQSIEVVKLYETRETDKMLFGTLLFPVL